MGDAVEIGWKEHIMKTFLNMLRDDSGASAAEYALILAIVGTAIALAAIGLGTAVGGAMNNASDCINDQTC
jgi:pilus assembly protein Flp/PilA